jgi:hypothetical protein
MVTVYFNFDKEESPKALRTPAFGDSFVWLGWRDSDPRVMESKSIALPLGYSPIKY